MTGGTPRALVGSIIAHFYRSVCSLSARQNKTCGIEGLNKIQFQILNLTANRLSSTKVNTEANNCELTQLIILDVSSNLIETIRKDDLSAFPNLRQLSATDNDLIEIHQDVFTKAPTLQHLDLENNELTEVAPLPEGLLHLNLARNRLSIIPAAIANLNKLISVNLSLNSIDANTPFSLLSESLESVDLSNNKLDSIPIKIIQQSLNSLLYLYLGGNQIAVLQPSQLQNLTRLQKVSSFKHLLCQSNLFKMGNMLFEQTVLFWEWEP